jgi:hypothetical protein
VASGGDEIGVEARQEQADGVRSGLRAVPGLRSLPAHDRTALGIWLLTRVTIFGFAWNLAWVTQPLKKYGPRGFGGLWQRWDWVRYADIAAHGYSLRARHGASIAFFPGYPLALRAVHLVLRSWVYTGLIISLVAGAVAAAALARIIAAEARPHFGAGEAGSAQTRAAVREGVLFWAFAPAAVFLAAGYTEALFLAFALPAWLAARRGRWLAAGVLLAAASAIRVNGLFEFAAVAVLFAQTRPRAPREWLRGAPLLIALAPVFAFMAYLHSLTGSWLAWQHAEAAGWNRHVTEPLRTLVNTLRYAFGGKLPPAPSASCASRTAEAPASRQNISVAPCTAAACGRPMNSSVWRAY